MKYIWTSPKLENVFTTERINKEWCRAVYNSCGYAMMRRTWIDEDVKTGTLAVWNGLNWMKMQYGKWVIHTPRRATQ